jgi:hypothetical protein
MKHHITRRFVRSSLDEVVAHACLHRCEHCVGTLRNSRS